MERYNKNMSAKRLVQRMGKGEINFDNAVQRGLVWDTAKKSLLIHSMLYGYSIPALYFTKDDGGIFDSLDGKQRSNAISEYLHDEYALTVDTPPVYDDDGKEDNVSGLKFSQLPEWAQDRIKDYTLTIYYYEGMTEQEIREFFRRLNNGKPLTAVELTRVNTPCLTAFQELAKHEAIQSVVSDAAKKRFTDENIAMQIYHIVTEENPDFSTKTFREWAKSVEVDDAVMERIRKGLDLYMRFVKYCEESDDNKVLKKVKTRTNFVSSILFFTLAAEHSNSGLIFMKLYDFFSGKPSLSEEYNRTVGSGSAKPSAVKTRRDTMAKLTAGLAGGEDEPEAIDDIDEIEEADEQEDVSGTVETADTADGGNEPATLDTTEETAADDTEEGAESGTETFDTQEGGEPSPFVAQAIAAAEQIAKEWEEDAE